MMNMSEYSLKQEKWCIWSRGSRVDIIQKTKEFVESRLSGESTGHDWFHTERVYKNSLKLMSETNELLDTDVVVLGSLLHDIADWKFTDGDESVGPKIARDWLQSINTDETIVNHVCEIIQDISFKGSGVKTPMKSLEGKIVQDADRLDAIGAIGVARTFAYGGFKGQEMYSPEIKPKTHQSKSEYKKQNTTSVNHFFEKLLLLKERMNTPAGKKYAEERHRFMIIFLEEFLKDSGYEDSVHKEILAGYK